jgi:BirA family transcriptional regulator, biotin operon repressor / biotin---[acetyl-CoA-carboxylase] ligase
VGVGVNVSSERDELPVPTATSLTLAGARAVDRSALLVSVLQAFGDRFDAWVREGGGGLRAPYTELCSTLDRPVRVDLPTGEVLQGTAVGVDEDGRLQVHDGVAVRALGAGDVVHVRGS